MQDKYLPAEIEQAAQQHWDATQAAQKALSCVYRTGQRFGVNYLIDVLLGKEHSRISQFGHDQLSVYGIGKDITDLEWRNIFRQLIALGFLTVDLDGHGGLRLTEKSRPLLRGEIELHLRKEQKRERIRKERTRTERAPRPEFDEMSAASRALFEQLRSLRLRLAQEQAVPPYVIFHDATLLHMTSEQPQTLDAMRAIPGIGERKLDQYGQAFLDVIMEQDSA